MRFGKYFVCYLAPIFMNDEEKAMRYQIKIFIFMYNNLMHNTIMSHSMNLR